MEPPKKDKTQKMKTNVIIKITLPDAKTYHTHAAVFKDLTAKTGGTMAVRME